MRNLNKKLAATEAVSYRATTLAANEGAIADVESMVSPPGMPSAEADVIPRPFISIFAWQVPLPSSLRALRHRNFRLYWMGQLVSLVGTWMQTIARSWLVWDLTHSAFWLGMVGFASSFPVLLLALWGGVLADKISKRTLVIWTQTTMMFTAFVLAALTWAGVVQVWHVIAISLISGMVFAFDAPARQAFTVEMVNGKEDLMNAVALNSAIFNGARVLGPAVGAIALAVAGPAMAFFLNGVSYLAVIAGLAMMKLPPFTRKVDTTSTKERILEGIRYVRHNDTIRTLMLLVAVSSVFAFPYTVLMPIFADLLRVGQDGYGVLMALSGVGSLVGAISLAVQSGRESTRRGRTIFFGSVGLPLFLGIFALSRSYLLSLALLIGVGYTMISVNSTINTVIQTNVPDELRGRVNGVYSLLFIGVAPLGNLQAGLIADHFGAPAALFIGALVCALSAAYILLRKRHIASMA